MKKNKEVLRDKIFGDFEEVKYKTFLVTIVMLLILSILVSLVSALFMIFYGALIVPDTIKYGGAFLCIVTASAIEGVLTIALMKNYVDKTEKKLKKSLDIIISNDYDYVDENSLFYESLIAKYLADSMKVFNKRYKYILTMLFIFVEFIMLLNTFPISLISASILIVLCYITNHLISKLINKSNNSNNTNNNDDYYGYEKEVLQFQEIVKNTK